MEVEQLKEIRMRHIATKHSEPQLFEAFKQVVRSVLQGCDSIDEIIDAIPHAPCENQQVGLIGEIVKRICDPCRVPFERKEIVYDKRKRVVVILESPHKYEFCKAKDGKWEPIGPACYCTGCRLARNWQDVFGNRFDDCELVLVNAVRFQCSLAAAGKYEKYKDEIIRHCLEVEELRSDFAESLTNLISQDTSFVNACTGKIGDCDSVHGRVSSILEGLEIKALNLAHPSSWRCLRNVTAQKRRVEAYYSSENKNMAKER